MKTLFEWSVAIIVVALIVIPLWGLSAWVFTLLWNWVVPGITGWPLLTFWQGVGIMLLLTFVGQFFKSSN